MKHLLLSLVFTISIFSVNAQESISQQSKIDAIFSKWDTQNSPGGTVGVIKEGKLIFSKGYGMANLDYNIPNQPKTVFRIGSTSKQFTAATIILLSQEGKLSLEDTLIKFFPNFPSYANDVTIQHLLNHTSGVRDYLILARLSGLSADDHYTDKMVEKWLTNQQELNFKPGDEFLYSNSGYWLLSQIVKKVSGVSMAKYAEKNIFIPLGMHTTFFNDNHKQVVKNRASGYRPNKKGGYAIRMTNLDMIGDGGVFTTVEDLAKWDASFYNSKTLNQDFWNQMTKVGTLNNGDKINYAAGLSIANNKGLKMIHHSGAFVGYKAEMLRFPEVQFSVIVLANRADSDPTQMAQRIANIFLKDEFKKEKRVVTKKPKTKSKKNVSIKLSKEELSVFVGDYWSEISKSSRKLIVKDGMLNYVRSNGRATKMRPIAKNKFQMIGPRVPVILDVNLKGKVKEFTLRVPNAEPLTFKVYKPVISYSATDLKTYSGDYYSAELDVVYSFKMKNNRIFLFVKGNPVGEVKSIKQNLLNISGRQTFEFNENRDMFRLSMLGRVKNVKFVKK